jgi:hypothetical protein
MEHSLRDHAGCIVEGAQGASTKPISVRYTGNGFCVPFRTNGRKKPGTKAILCQKSYKIARAANSKGVFVPKIIQNGEFKRVES